MTHRAPLVPLDLDGPPPPIYLDPTALLPVATVHPVSAVSRPGAGKVGPAADSVQGDAR